MSELPDDEAWPGEVDGELGAGGRSWRMPSVPAPFLLIASLVVAVVALLAAAAQLSAADLGTTLRARHCDTSPLLGLALLTLGAAALAITPALHALSSHRVTRLRFRPTSLGLAVPVPLLLLALTLPGTLGCRSARSFGDAVLLGDALIGTSGVMLAAGAAVLLGAMIASAWQGVPVGGGLPGPDDGLAGSLIEQAIAAAHDPEARRFRGVDG